jgi:hypothetical protein
MRTFAVALVLASVAVAGPALADVPARVGQGQSAVPLVWSPALIAKVKEQIGIHEGRAAALQPILARDITARDSLQADAAALEQVAKDELRQAAEFKSMAALATDKSHRKEFEQFANELENFAKKSEESAKTHRELSQRLAEPIRHMQADIAYHLERAAKLKTALANNS